MENKIFENNIKSTFDSYQPALDNDAIWDKIEPHLNKKKDRKYIIFWFFLIGSAIGLWFFNTEENSVIKGSHISLTEKVEQNNPRNLNLPKLNETTSKSVIAEKSINSKNNKTSILSVVENKKNLITKTPVDRLPISHIDHKNALTYVEKEKVETKSMNLNLDLINVYSLIFNGLENTSDYFNQIVENKKSKDLRETTLSIKPLRNNRWDFIFQSTVAPIFPVKILSKKGGVGDFHLKERKDTESQLEGFGINLNFQAKSKRGLVFTTGIEYQQFNEKYDLKESSVREETTIGEIIIVENANGEVIRTVNGPVQLTTIIDTRKRRFNNYRFVNFPIGIGRAWKKNNTFYKLFGGIQYNALFRFSGKIASPVSDLTYNGDFKRKIGYGVWISGEYGWEINERLKWVVAPKIQIPFQSITADNYNLNQRYYPISLNIGINYLLNPQKKHSPINRHRKN